MCSLNDEDESCNNLVFSEKLTLSGSTTCRSCDQKASVVLRRKDVYCRNCFLAAETHKFRATLGKSKMMKPQDKVLVAYSGSQSSAALLHLLYSGVKESEHKKLLFSVCVLFIEEGVIHNEETEKRLKVIENIQKNIISYNFPFFVTTLSETFNDEPVIDTSLNINEDNDAKLKSLFGNIRSMTSKEDLLYLLRQKLLIKAAHQLQCNKIFTAEIATDLAVKLLSTFSLGRGDQVSFETGFCDSRNSSIKILRPMRDFTSKEIVFYNLFYQIETVSLPSLTTKSPSNISIKKLTEKFITGLQDDFPSTVYTIYKTGEKLGIKADNNVGDEQTCLLCQDKIRTNKIKSNYSAVEAAIFSRNVSRKKLDNCVMKQKNGCCGSCSNDQNSDITEIELETFLCYGCALILRDLKNMEYLPKYVVRSAIQRRDFESMKEQISDFLIEPSAELEV